jgi:hypothetical protein
VSAVLGEEIISLATSGSTDFSPPKVQEDMAGYATLMTGTINAYKIFVRKHEEKKQLGICGG